MQVLLLVLLLLLPLAVKAEYLGNLSSNEFDPNSAPLIRLAQGIPSPPDLPLVNWSIPYW